ncbi:hypothetical protein D3C85_1843440 [compost metagenome]
MSAQVSNLLPEYPRMTALGIDLLRLSPRAEGMAQIIQTFADVRAGALPPLAVDGCNGYWHGQAGMLRVEESGL